MHAGFLTGLASSLALAVTVAPLHAQSEPSRSFTQAGDWTLDAGDDYCRLAANFSDGEDQIAFALERNRAENFARLILIGDAIVPYRGADVMGYRFLPAGEEREARFLRSETPGGDNYFNLGNVVFAPLAFAPGTPPPAPAAGLAGPEGSFLIPPYDRAAELTYARGVTGIAIVDGLREGIHIDTGSLRGPLQALQACTDDLLRVWGLDYEAHQTMTRRATPAGPAHEWLATGTIGFQDFALLGGGANAVRVMVNEAGEPTSCNVHWASLSETTNNRICTQIMANARFEPALDAAGNPMASYWTVDPIFGLTRPFGRR